MRDIAYSLSRAVEDCGDVGGGGDAQDSLGKLLGVTRPLLGDIRDALDGLETFWRAREGERLLQRRPNGLDALGARYAAGKPGRCYFKCGLGEVRHPLGHQVEALRALEEGHHILLVVPTGAGKTGVTVAYTAAHHEVEILAAVAAAAASTPLPKLGVVLTALVSTMMDQESDLNRRLGARFAVALRRTTTRQSRHRTSLVYEPYSLAATVDEAMATGRTATTTATTTPGGTA